MPLDLHVLSLPLAFILSQDQTLHCIIPSIFSSFKDIDFVFFNVRLYLTPVGSSMSSNISKPSATLVPLFSKIYSPPPPRLPSPAFHLFIPLSSHLVAPSSFGIAKILPFPLPTKYFSNFFLSPHFNTLIPTKKFFTQIPAAIAVCWRFLSIPQPIFIGISVKVQAFFVLLAAIFGTIIR